MVTNTLAQLSSCDADTIILGLKTIRSGVKQGLLRLDQVLSDAIGDMFLMMASTSMPEREIEAVLLTFREQILVDINDDFDATSFAVSDRFMNSLLVILRGFWTEFPEFLDLPALSDNKASVRASYRGHVCFEIGLHVVLGLIETSSLMTSTVATLRRCKLFPEILKLFGDALSNDIAFHTQVGRQSENTCRCVVMLLLSIHFPFLFLFPFSFSFSLSLNFLHFFLTTPHVPHTYVLPC